MKSQNVVVEKVSLPKAVETPAPVEVKAEEKSESKLEKLSTMIESLLATFPKFATGKYDGGYAEKPEDKKAEESKEEEKKAESVPGVPGTEEAKKADDQDGDNDGDEDDMEKCEHCKGSGKVKKGETEKVVPAKAEAAPVASVQAEAPKVETAPDYSFNTVFNRSKVGLSQKDKEMHEMLNKAFGIQDLLPKL